jgi:hypothetical protein
MCASRLYRYDHCVQCGRQTVSSFSGVAEEHYCDSCLQDAGDAYIQMQIDIERGK